MNANTMSTLNNTTTTYHGVQLGLEYKDIWLTIKSLPNPIKYTSIILNTVGVASHTTGLYLLSTAKRNRGTEQLRQHGVLHQFQTPGPVKRV